MCIRDSFIRAVNSLKSGRGKLIIVIKSSSSSDDGNICELRIRLLLVSLSEDDNSFIVLIIDGSS